MHVVDCEADATDATLRDYLTAMGAALGRPPVIYSADWWFQPRGWKVAPLAPWLWAAPNAGYLDGYPGDDSPHWQAGYGGRDQVAVMQYAVTPVDGIRVSRSATRRCGTR